MAKHHSPLFDQMIQEAKDKGIRVSDKGNGVFILYPSDKTKPMHTFHKGVLGEKPLRKWLDKNS
jgi:hypothetical protein